MKATQYYKQSVESQTASVFLELFQLQIRLNDILKTDQPYGREIEKIVQSIDDLFDLMLEE